MKPAIQEQVEIVLKILLISLAGMQVRATIRVLIKMMQDHSILLITKATGVLKKGPTEKNNG
jgi:hypothetical protein